MDTELLIIDDESEIIIEVDTDVEVLAVAEQGPPGPQGPAGPPGPVGYDAPVVEALRIDSSGNVLATRGALGYGVGAGGTATQTGSRTSGVILNKPSGQITLVSAAGTAAWQSFTVTNSVVALADTPIVAQVSGTDLYEIHVTAVATGSFRISFRTTGGTTTEQPVFNFEIFKGATS